MKNKRALVIDPYLDTLGGGERYMLTAANCLAQLGFETEVWGFGKEWKPKAEEKFGLNLNDLQFVPQKIERLTLLHRRQLMKDYDLCFWLTDGSLPFLFAKQNILHFQVPFRGVNTKPILNKFKLKGISQVVCNSRFTKKVIDQEFGVRSVVIYPPVGVTEFQPGKKEKVILYTGRFT
ncbi:glycosyltransferase, partial [Patescibacteria group bacterium]|nr:glycosyltransferase [Patescibacteria group bacterium]